MCAISGVRYNTQPQKGRGIVARFFAAGLTYLYPELQQKV